MMHTPTYTYCSVMYSCIMTYLSPKKGILTLANHNWKITCPHCFFGNSYSSPTPAIHTPQNLGLGLVKLFATHILYATRKLNDHYPTPRAPTVPVLVSTFADHPR